MSEQDRRDKSGSKRKVKKCHDFIHTVKQIDQFGESVGFTFEDGSRTKNTLCGTLLSLILLCLLFLYGLSKYNDLRSGVET